MSEVLCDLALGFTDFLMSDETLEAFRESPCDNVFVALIKIEIPCPHSNA